MINPLTTLQSAILELVQTKEFLDETLQQISKAQQEMDLLAVQSWELPEEV